MENDAALNEIGGRARQSRWVNKNWGVITAEV